MKVRLLSHSSLYLVVLAARTCHESLSRSDSNFDSIGLADKEFLKSLVKRGHHSVFEHLYFTFHIEGCSRLMLQELVRHRIASYSVKSTRYTLNRAIDQISSMQDVDKFIVVPEHFDDSQKNSLRYSVFNLIMEMKKMKEFGMCQDDLKYFLPECWKTELVMTINARSLFNFFRLRLDKAAHWEIRELARKMYEAIPEEYKFIFDAYFETVK